jgi:membrane-associated HD superfamily phosphohydrolase
MAVIPLMILPFILYNLVMFGAMGSGGVAALDNSIFSLDMMSGATWTMSLGDLLLLVALFVLFFEIIKATRRRSAVMDHLLSMLLFIVFLVEFLLAPAAATHVFFLLMSICFIDVAAGFTISITSAGRDVSIGL